MSFAATYPADEPLRGPKALGKRPAAPSAEALQNIGAICSRRPAPTPSPQAQASPQDSPLSPILIVNFTAPLFEALRDRMGIIAVKYADNVKLIAFGRNFYRCWIELERVWHTAAR